MDSLPLSTKKPELIDNPRRAEWDLLPSGRAVLAMSPADADAHLSQADHGSDDS